MLVLGEVRLEHAFRTRYTVQRVCFSRSDAKVHRAHAFRTRYTYMYGVLVLAVATPKCVQWDAIHGPSTDRLAVLQSVQTVQIVKLFSPPCPSLMKCNSWTINRPTRSFTIRTDCTDRQIVLLPDQQIDAYAYQTVNGSTTTFHFDRPYRSYVRLDRLYQCVYIGHEWICHCWCEWDWS